MRIASFNLENLFARARIMNLGSWDAGKDILNKYSILTGLIQKTVYSDQDKQTILEGINFLGLDQGDETQYVILRQNKGQLLRRPQAGPTEVVANGRGDWIGWLDLRTEAVNEVATAMTANVIRDVGADVLAVIEVENRVTLDRFNEQLLRPAGAAYHRVMLIDGNDDRGIDVGILTHRSTRSNRWSVTSTTCWTANDYLAVIAPNTRSTITQPTASWF